MKKHKGLLIFIAVVLQCAAFGAICLQRETVLRTGEQVFMRTAPVDPRDLFRGDYVRLRYEVSTLPIDMAATDEAEEMQEPETRVYLSYSTDDRNMMAPQRLSLAKPSGERFIRGYSERGLEARDIQVRYGIEKFFMQQGKGLALERGLSVEGIQIPLEMKVAVGRDNGIAVLKGYRYADLGLGITVQRAADRTKGPSLKIKLKVVNASQSALGIVDPEDHSTFKLEISSTPASRKHEKTRLKETAAERETFRESDIKTIPPQSVYEFELDLTLPQYELVRGKKSVPWSDMGYGEAVQIIYETPPPAKVEGLQGADKLWQGRLPSRSLSRWDFRD